MHARALFFPLAGALVTLVSLASWAGCGTTETATPLDAGNVMPTVDAGSATCAACATDDDCHGGVCAQLGGDSYCASTCPNGNECGADTACMSVSTVTGQQVSVCVPRGAVCGDTDDGDDAGVPDDTCGTLVGPKVTAGCTCTQGAACQANGCYGGWWCNTATNRCQAPPTVCPGASDAGVPYDGGGPVTANIGANGGTSSRLLFAVVGDSRPANPEDTAGYPTPIITKIFSDIDALPAKPPFVVATGDYIFAYPNSAQSSPQLDLYLAARAKYSGAFFPALGNHECTGATASNCGPEGANGTTKSYTNFLSKMLGPIGKTDPYYSIEVDAPDASYTAKFVFVAANAWSTAQATWLDTAMAKPTTYTFVVRHEPKNANTAPGVDPSEQIMAKYPYTLALVGHTHTYGHYNAREVIIGNGGAPLSGSKNYGFVVISQRPDNTLDVDELDYQSGLRDAHFHFRVKPDGTPAP